MTRAKFPRVDGILLLDKPHGMTSNRALQEAKKLLQARKAGHTGSLDPLATGLLPLTFGEATKLSRFLLEADKRYHTVVKLGVTTTTDDAEGEVVSTRPVNVDRAAIEKALKGFVGEIEQIPPMYSAIKQEGQPLYKLARAGVTTERAPRRVHIHEIHLLDVAGDRVTLDVACSKGTYIRTLAHDLGEVLGCGGHVAELRRTGMGGFAVEEAVSLADLAALSGPAERRARLVPADQALRAYPAVTLTRNAAFYLLQGQAVTGAKGLTGWVRLYEDRGAEGPHFLGLGEATGEGQVAPRRLLHAPEAAENP